MGTTMFTWTTGLEILPVPIWMGQNCRIPFPDERIDTRRDYAAI
jgi:hypothetical protein